MAVVFHIKSKTYVDCDYESRFLFREKYLGIVRDTLDDWIIYYQPMPRAGKRPARPAGYFAAACVTSIRTATNNPGYYEARLEQFFEFPAPVPFSIRDASFGPIFYFEDGMLESDGSVNASLAQQEVRVVSDESFYRIIERAFGKAIFEHGPIHAHGFAEDAPASTERTRILMSRSIRDRAFRQLVGNAYGMTCAMTGISMQAPDHTFEV